MIRLACFLLITVLFLSAQAAQADTTVIKYKKYLIPIKLPPEIEAPTLTATRESNNTVLLDWSQPTGATSFELHRRTQNSTTWVLIYSGTELTYTHANAPAGIVAYRITPCNDEGCSRSNAQASVTVPEVTNAGGWTFVDDPALPTNPDTDGDGVRNQFDFCANTPAGSVVNARGCAVSQTGAPGSGGAPYQCLDPVTSAVISDPNCPVAQRDSDFDAIADINDAYPSQSNGFCPAN